MGKDEKVTVVIDETDILRKQNEREDEPLRQFCVAFKDGTFQIHDAHRLMHNSGMYFSFLDAKGSSEWIRFIVHRNGRDDVVAMVREADVKSVYEQVGDL